MDRTTMLVFVKFLKENKLTIALAESMTCGWVSHKVGCFKDTSQVFEGSIVCYDKEVKIKILGLSRKFIEQFTPESAEVTEALAKNLSKLFDASICAAITGLATTGGSETAEKPVGTVFISFMHKNKIYSTRKLFRGSPLEIKKKAGDYMLKFIFKEMKQAIHHE